MIDYSIFTNALLAGKKDSIEDLADQAMNEGAAARDVLNKGLIMSMNIVGDKMETGELFIPEVLMAARVMSIGVEHLKPLLEDGDSNGRGKMVIGTVKGDLHDIGKNLVAMMCEGRGLEVVNLGVDVPADRFIEAAREHDAGLICLSALLTTTMPEMEKTVAALRSSELSDTVKVMVGGAPVTDKFADDIGADAYSEDAGAAARTALELLAG